MPNDPDLLDIKTPARSIPPVAMVFGREDEDANYVAHAHPLPVRNGSSGISLIERLTREGDPFSNYNESSFSSFGAPAGAGTASAAGTSGAAVGRAIFIQNVIIGSTTPISGRYQIGGSSLAGVGTPPVMDVSYSCGPNFNVVLPVNTFLRSGDVPLNGPSHYIKRWLDGSVTGTHYVTTGVIGWTLADSINFDAEKTIAMFGDSKWNGTGPTTVKKCIPWLINRYYREKGIDCRFILKAYSGSTTGGHEEFRSGGRYDNLGRLDAMFYNLGTNDAAQAISTATSLANVAAFITWKQRHYPEAKLVIFGSEPLQNNTYEAALVALRAAVSAHVTGLADPNVLFCDLGGAFDRTVGNNYATSDGADGTRVHPDNDGNTFVWSGGYGSWAGLESWLTANLAEI